MENHTDVFGHAFLGSGGGIFIVGLGKQSQEHTVHAHGGFHAGGHDLAAVVVIHILQIFAGKFGVAGNIPGAAVVDAFQFAPAKGELHFDINGGFGVMRQFFVFVDPVIVPVMLYGVTVL